MKLEFAVGITYHSWDGSPENIGNLRFPDYDTAEEFAKQFRDGETGATVFAVVDNKYVFYCQRYAIEENNIAYFIHYQSYEWGQVQTTIWRKHLENNPEKFYKYASYIIPAP